MSRISPLGQRIIVVGTTCSGKSTLAQRLAGLVEAPYVELDALFWKPGWTDSPDEEFFPRIAEATAGATWVVAGNYSRSQHLTWPRAQTIVWLDLPLRVVLCRVLARSWRRWRRREVLWGTNVERFWPNLAVWTREKSLLWWALHSHGPMRERMLAAMVAPEWAHIRFIRLRSMGEVQEFVRGVEAGMAKAGIPELHQAAS